MADSKVYRVVVADDEPEFRKWLKSLMDESEDFRLIGEASSGAEAINIIPLLLPDLVIADMYLPEPDGLEVAQYVQRNFSGIKSILVSTHQGNVYDDLAKEGGALAFVPKSRFSIDAIRQALKEVVKQ